MQIIICGQPSTSIKAITRLYNIRSQQYIPSLIRCGDIDGLKIYLKTIKDKERRKIRRLIRKKKMKGTCCDEK